MDSKGDIKLILVKYYGAYGIVVRKNRNSKDYMRHFLKGL